MHLTPVWRETWPKISGTSTEICLIQLVLPSRLWSSQESRTKTQELVSMPDPTIHTLPSTSFSIRLFRNITVTAPLIITYHAWSPKVLLTPISARKTQLWLTPLELELEETAPDTHSVQVSPRNKDLKSWLRLPKLALVSRETWRELSIHSMVWAKKPQSNSLTITSFSSKYQLYYHHTNPFFVSNREGDRFLKACNLNRDWPSGRGIFHNDDKTFLVWVNEEDQLRIISMQPGAGIKEVFDRLCRAAAAIEKVLAFAHDEHLGYITSCPTNLGTALRASVHIKLPKLMKNKEVFNKIAD